jgi:hypothetical protein
MNAAAHVLNLGLGRITTPTSTWRRYGHPAAFHAEQHRRPCSFIQTLRRRACRWRSYNRQLALKAPALFEHTLCLMHIAPDPGGRGNSAHHWMLRVMEMFGGVLARRRIATANVAAASALAKSNPKRALDQAFLAGVRSSLRREILGFQPRQMFTRFGHRILRSQRSIHTYQRSRHSSASKRLSQCSALSLFRPEESHVNHADQLIYQFAAENSSSSFQAEP